MSSALFPSICLPIPFTENKRTRKEELRAKSVVTLAGIAGSPTRLCKACSLYGNRTNFPDKTFPRYKQTQAFY
jgi:hypothetical protein